jgi:hypothetical protein
VGACGCVLSCMALSVHTVQDRRLSGRMPNVGDSWAWLPGSQARAKLGHKDELNQVDRWQDPTCLWFVEVG